MDARDNTVMTLLESDGFIDDLTMVTLIKTLVGRMLGPDTINGVYTVKIPLEDPRLVALHARSRACERKAVQVMQSSHWYTENRWPTPLNETIADSFCTWVDNTQKRLAG